MTELIPQLRPFLPEEEGHLEPVHVNWFETELRQRMNNDQDYEWATEGRAYGLEERREVLSSFVGRHVVGQQFIALTYEQRR